MISPGCPLPHRACGLSPLAPPGVEAPVVSGRRHFAIPHNSHSHAFFLRKVIQAWTFAFVCMVNYTSPDRAHLAISSVSTAII